MPTTLPDQASSEQSADVPAQAPPEPEPVRFDADDEVSGIPLRFEAQLTGVLAVPFKADSGGAAWGFGLTYAVGWGALPLLLGLDVMSVNGLSESRTFVDVAAGDRTLTASQLSRSRQLLFDAWLRLQPPRWSVRPYIEGFAGTKLFQTRYSIAVGPMSGDAIDAREWVGSLGCGAGVDFSGLLNASGTLSLALGVRWLSGGRADMTRRAVIDGQLVAIGRTLATDALLFMIGVGGRYDLSAPHPSDPW